MAGLTVLNLGLANRADNTDTTLDLISVMAQAYDEGGEGGFVSNCKGLPSDDPCYAKHRIMEAVVVYGEIVTTECGFHGWIERMPFGAKIIHRHGTDPVGSNKNCSRFSWSNYCCQWDIGFYYTYGGGGPA